MKEKITDNVVIGEDGCWNWKLSTNSSGYGQLFIEGKYHTAHRLSFSLFKEEIPKGCVVRHTCHNRKCCNPEHLLSGTQKDNWKDSEDSYRKAHRRRSKSWKVLDKTFNSCRSACEETGLSMNSLNKYTKNGVFDVNAYREGCAKARRKPVV